MLSQTLCKMRTRKIGAASAGGPDTKLYLKRFKGGYALLDCCVDGFVRNGITDTNVHDNHYQLQHKTCQLFCVSLRNKKAPENRRLSGKPVEVCELLRVGRCLLQHFAQKFPGPLFFSISEDLLRRRILQDPTLMQE